MALSSPKNPGDQVSRSIQVFDFPKAISRHEEKQLKQEGILRVLFAFRERRFVGAQTSSNAFCTVKSHGVGRQAWHRQAEKSGVERSVTAGPEPGRASSEQHGHLSARNAFRRRRILPQRGSAVAICGGCAQEPFRETITAVPRKSGTVSEDPFILLEDF